MNLTIKCIYCGKDNELTEVLSHEVEEQLLAKDRQIHAQELSQLKKKLIQAEQNELEIRKLKNALDEDKRKFELDRERQIDAEREKIRQKTLEEYGQLQKLKDREKDKIIDDLKKSLEDAQRKASQSSQQLAGEVQELELEEILRREFPGDAIEPIGKGDVGADIRQRVKSPRGVDCGSILWESKRTKAWADGWIVKLKEDVRNDKANIPAIVTQTLPAEIKNELGIKDGVWIATPKFVIPLAMLLRKALLDAGRQKMIIENRKSKAEELYTYLTSNEFTQQVEGMMETYKAMQEQITKERIAYEKSWKLREAQVNQLLVGVSGIYGSMQGIAGTALPTIKTLELA